MKHLMVSFTWLDEINQVVDNHTSPDHLKLAVKAHGACREWLNKPTKLTYTRFWKAWNRLENFESSALQKPS